MKIFLVALTFITSGMHALDYEETSEIIERKMQMFKKIQNLDLESVEDINENNYELILQAYIKGRIDGYEDCLNIMMELEDFEPS
ncbi:MAG: hypothetical protein KGI50_05495 [Patescibacteria group bacterium]|nr:hypothetical protein [Patescibacteria group bacterium]MDE2438740.1 hypothetical protein [Patescibacteria group bacterium]